MKFGVRGRVCCFFWPLVFSGMAAASPLTQGQKVEELQQLATLIKSSYGPYQLKQQNLHIDADKLVTRYSERAEKLSNLEFYYLLNQYVAEFQDSHFSSRVKSNHLSYLGFQADRIQGMVLIDSIDRTLLPKEKFPFVPGDEIVSWGGKPVQDEVTELSSYLGSGFAETRLRSATMLLPYRSSSSVPPQYDTVKIAIKLQKTGEVGEVELPWRQKGGAIEEGVGWGSVPLKTDYLNLSTEDFFEGFPIEKSYMCSPKTRISPPDDATIMMGEPFVAYYYPTPKGNIGYLRIPHYSWPDSAALFQKYEWAVYQFEQKTVGLIIDQDHNCGGKVNFLEDMLKLFAEKPFKGVEFQFLANRGEYLTFRDFAQNEEAHTLSAMDLTEIVGALKTAWTKGDRMTPRITYHGTRLLQPNSIRYTKPIIVLTDEMSGSGGDAFPAMMQGLGRAKILGTRTMGAGGHVVEAGPLNYSGNTLRLTKSLFYHPNGTPIENNGVTPDFAYKPTVNDFLGEYQEYQKFYTEKILSLIPAAH